MKNKETLEETVKRDFEAGYKLAQERSYSEEEVLKMLFDYQQSYSYASNEIGLKKWFEKFKKK